jgi:ATP phosphoribosyltransferase regulatory subunit
MDTLIRALQVPVDPRRIFVPVGTAAAARRKLRAEGYVTVAGLAPVDDPVAEARRLGCGFVLKKGAVTALAGGGKRRG